MSISNASKYLWSNAPVWRNVSILAATSCLVVGLHGLFGNSSTQGSSPKVTSGSGSISAPGPVTTAARQPVSGPISPVAAVAPRDPSIQARLNLFESHAQAAQKILDNAKKCEAYRDKALPVIKEGDRLSADQNIIPLISEADGCITDLNASDIRLKKIVDAASIADKEKTGSSYETLAKIREQSLTAFDLTRTLTTEQQTAIEAGKKAIGSVSKSNHRINKLVDDVKNLHNDSSPQLWEIAAKSDELITKFDLTRHNLSREQQQALKTGKKATQLISSSDQRLLTLEDTLTKAKQRHTKTTQQRLITAVATIQSIDKKRLDGIQLEKFNQARDLAAQYSLKGLIDQAEAFTQSQTVKQHEELCFLRKTIDISAVKMISPEQKSAIQLADEACDRVEASDRRLQELLSVSEKWEKVHDTTSKGLVNETLKIIDEFDKSRFSRKHMEAFNSIKVANTIIDAPDKGLSWEHLKSLPVYIKVIHATEGWVNPLKQDVARLLRKKGISLVSKAMDAALFVELNGDVVRVSENSNNRNLFSVTTEVAMAVSWAINTTTFYRETAMARGHALSTNAATALSFEKSNERVVDRFYDHLSK